jgi:hypothetical protein
MKTRILIAATSIAVGCIALSTIGCSKGQQQTSGPAASAPALANTTGLPLPDTAVVIDARQFHQTIDPSQEKGTAISSLGKGNYDGNEVVASSTASTDELNKWLTTVNPPAGYTRANIPANVATTVQRYGISYVVFTSGNSKGATVIVMDPKTVNAKLGPVLRVLDSYSSLPPQMRAGMDSQVKARTGQSISEMMDKSAPLGAAIAAVNEFRNSDKRAIILVTAQKI